MAQLIIGHTTDTTARIWVQADKCHYCEVTVDPPHAQSIGKSLSRETDYTVIVNFTELRPKTIYTVQATFSPDSGPVLGRFRTMASREGEQPLSFSFVLSSCNLTVISINNLLAYLLAAAGTTAAVFSLDLPLDRWKWFGPVWLRGLLKRPLRLMVKIVAWIVNKTTGLKQSGPPYLRSPFLKLTAVFESFVLDVVGDRKSLPAVGDLISTSSGEGVLACSATEVKSGWRLVLTQVRGSFAESDDVFKRPAGAPEEQKKSVGVIAQGWRGPEWYDNPSFFIHAGDQIYYDFPTEKRRPDRNEYRLAYREAWSDDSSNRYLLANWPHYMTLDDHEIADQFARDFKPPANPRWPGGSPEAEVTSDDYLREAMVAYREYVHARNPAPNDGDRGSAESYWYHFDKGAARFFVLDTRTRRFDNGGTAGQIIDPTQMQALLAWTTDHKDDLKFVVTSVPFVAQINDCSSEDNPNWYAQDQATGERDSARLPTSEHPMAERSLNPANDKWSAPRFKAQRDEIIKHIADNSIEHLVFLTGDMHCCYHATMRIGAGSKYDCTTVHELAGGPANQLQLANVTDFVTRHKGRTSSGCDYEIVLDRFHSEVNAVMHLKVVYVDDEQFAGSAGSRVPEVEWSVIRTLTDSGASAWEDDPEERSRSAKPMKTSQDEPVRKGEPTMTGRISFVRKRKPSDLPDWPWRTAGAAARSDEKRG